MTIRLLAVISGLLMPMSLYSAEAGALLKSIRSVGSEGKGNAEAGKAWSELVKMGPEVMPEILGAMDGADIRVINWLRTALDAVGESALKNGKKPPTKELEAFLRNTTHDGRARRSAYEWLVRIDPKTPEKFLPDMLNDPAGELRREAVAAKLKEAEAMLKSEPEKAKATLNTTMAAARDPDQLAILAKHLKTFDVEVNLTMQLGLVTQWKLLAPFDNTNGKGFAAVYPPEKGIDLKGTFKGKKDAECMWIDHQVPDDPKVALEPNKLGIVDLNKAIGKHMGVVGYAYVEVKSAVEQAVQVRLGSYNSVKMYLNGKEIFSHEEYHHGMRMDQYTASGVLKKGTNTLMLKVCQNEQTDTWAQSWLFQVRLCDALGGALPVEIVTPRNANPKDGKVQP